ncbi:hypothetical protein DFH09DRAFT_1082505 [Mycena vulgaris]|nr:hypothetical protein DFH09DRAFT_1082505 [Mycena vulgaris]
MLNPGSTYTNAQSTSEVFRKLDPVQEDTSNKRVLAWELDSRPGEAKETAGWAGTVIAGAPSIFQLGHIPPWSRPRPPQGVHFTNMLLNSNFRRSSNIRSDTAAGARRGAHTRSGRFAERRRPIAANRSISARGVGKSKHTPPAPRALSEAGLTMGCMGAVMTPTSPWGTSEAFQFVPVLDDCTFPPFAIIPVFFRDGIKPAKMLGAAASTVVGPQEYLHQQHIGLASAAGAQVQSTILVSCGRSLLG